jgi:polyhydroxyalkanoate synthesis regulator phasin
MKKGLKILMIVLVAGAIVLGGAVYSIISGKINISSSDLLSTAFAENVLMCNDKENGIHFKLIGHGIIEEVLKILGLDETGLKSAWESGKTLLEFAESKGITKEKLVQTFKDVITEKLDELLKDGKITETEKENFLKDIDSRIEDFITNTPPFGKGKGLGRGKPPIDKIPGEPPIQKGFFFDGKGIMEDVLTKLNLSLDEFQTAVKEGKSLLEFAESKGITKEKLVTVVKEVVTNKVEQLVKDGKMTEEQKTKFLSNLDDFVERFINGPRRGHHGGRGNHGIENFNNLEASLPSSNL